MSETMPKPAEAPEFQEENLNSADAQEIGKAAVNAAETTNIASQELDEPAEKAKAKFERTVVNQWGEKETLTADTEEELREAVNDFREASNDR